MNAAIATITGVMTMGTTGDDTVVLIKDTEITAITIVIIGGVKSAIG